MVYNFSSADISNDSQKSSPDNSDRRFVLQSGQDVKVKATGAQLFLKRLIDIVLSISALFVLSPFLFAVAFLVKSTSQGPIFFKQKRWGLNCKPITVLKFRTMYTALGDPSGVLQTVPGDSRVTKVGQVLRRYSIDELPQLFNVLVGDMSLVGPRCHAIGMKAAGVLYEELVPTYHQRHLMRPGITGLAQVRGHRGPTNTPSSSKNRIISDIYYIENYSLTLDVKILVRTVLNEIGGGTGI